MGCYNSMHVGKTYVSTGSLRYPLNYCLNCPIHVCAVNLAIQYLKSFACFHVSGLTPQDYSSASAWHLLASFPRLLVPFTSSHSDKATVA
jgi:hypothetical protein